RADAMYFWNEHGGPPRVAAVLENYPWIAPRLMEGESIMISDVDDLPPEAWTDAENLREGGLTSIVAVPLAIANKVLGVFTLGNLTRTREWSEQEMSDLRVIAGMFVNVVNRVMTRQSLDEALEELRVAKERLEAENVYLQQEIRSTHGFDDIVGESPQLNRCLRQVEMVAETTTAVLIQGDTGTGKELIARAVHELSDRNDRPLVKVNCAALPANLIESELFGHEKGAFTGALNSKRGRFDLADGGTLFLDEIGDFPLELQGKLLRVIQEGEFERLGGTETIKVDVRLIAATNRNLQEAVDDGEFRADLFYRINTFPIYLPRLSERVGDVPLLAQHFAAKHAALLGKDVTAISASMMERLNAYDWPGNVRELEGVIQRALISAKGAVLDSSDIPNAVVASAPDQPPPASSAADLRVAERNHIAGILDDVNWVIGGENGAAARLGIPPSTLRSKMKKLGIQRPISVS
ncbi:MAG: sigma 54-interacting transcriptional regulator, partial [Gammaproteobacteria bacterium]|nr:sigma 54-interacting transcriptional regulator [Gammaproteobacteria bacterium]